MNTPNDSVSRRYALDILRGAAPQWLGIAIGIVGTAAMLLVVEGLGPEVPTNAPVILFLIPVVVSAYVGGLAPGLVSTGVAVLTTEYFLLPPVHSWHVTSRVDAVKLMALAAVGVVVSILMERSLRPELKFAPVRRHIPLPVTEHKVRSSFWFLVTCLVAIATVSNVSVVRMNQDAAWVDHTHQVISGLRMLLATVTDGETGQRGYIITGQESYLEPYRSSVAHTSDVLRQVRALTADNALEQRRLDALEPLIAQRMARLEEGVELRRKQGLEAAQRHLLSGMGKQLHDRIRQAVSEMEETEFMLLRERQAGADRTIVVTEAVIVGTGLLALILGGMAQFLVIQGFAASRLSEAELEQRVRERTDELAQANVLLKYTTERLNLALNAAKAGTWGWDPQTNTDDWSGVLRAFYGIEADSSESPGDAWRQLVHPDDLPKVEGAMEEARQNATELNVEWRARSHDGSERWFVSRGRPIFDPNCELLKIVGMTFDVTEHKRAEETLSRLAAIVESSDDAIIGKKLDGTITSWNAGAQRLYGFTPQEAIGQSILIITPPDRQQETEQILSTIAASGKVERLESVRRRKDKTEVEVSVTVSPIRDAAGKITGASTIAHDITERRQTEQQTRLYNLLVYQSRDIILFIREQDGRIVAANAAAETAYGYSREELLELSVYDLRPSDSPEAIRAQFHGADSHDVLFEAIHRRKDGSTFPVEVSSNGETIDGARTILSVVRDITDRKRMEEEARRLNRQIELILESAITGVVGLDENGAVTFANPTASRLLGFEANEMIGRDSHSLLHSVRGDGTAHDVKDCPIHRSIHTGKEERGEEWFWRKGGNGFPVMFASGPIQESGKVVGAVVTFNDISERKQMEADLRDSEEQFRTLANAIPQLCWMANADGWIFWYNDRWFEYTGTTPEQMEGWGWQSVHDPEELPHVLARWQSSIATGEPFNMVFPLRGADGVFHPFLTRVMPVRNRSGKVVQWFGTNTDISEQREAEEGLRKSRMMFENLFEFTPDAVVTMDSHGQITRVNTQAEKSFGYGRAELVGQSIELLVPERYRVAHASHRQKYGATPVSRPMGTGLELYGRRKDGTEFPAEIQLNTIETDGGPLVLTVTHDVTDRKRAQQEIQQLNADLEQRVCDRTAQLESSNKELEAFAYSVSHDLRAPIRHLSAFSESLRERSYKKLDERARHYLDNIHAASQQMGTLIDDLLKFSRLGRAGMSKADVALEPLVQEVRRELEPEMNQRNIVWKVSSLPTIHADPALLRQVFVNLMANAVKYTRGRQEARIEIGCTDGTPGEHAIFIRDNGVGFEMAYVHKLFGVFQRLHTEFEGTGIGLANVRRIVERHGGRVWAEGVPEEGATFYFSIPNRGGGE